MTQTITLSQKINDVVSFLKTVAPFSPEIGIIMGTGLGGYAKNIAIEKTVPYGEIPHLPHATAPGHSGNLIFGTVGGKKVVAMQGRLHMYEGNTPQTASILVRAMKKLGIHTIIISCASGGLNRLFKAGDIMLIDDHINLTGMSPLTGENLDEFGPRFPVMFDIYDKKLGELAHQIALENKIELRTGVYAGYSGPHYCTRAELSYFTQIGGDAVGMSVVHEVITAVHAGIRVLGLAAITDMALPYAEKHATEEEVIESGKLISVRFEKLTTELITRM